MSTFGRRSSRTSINIWPGFVDALATLLLVVIFVLMVFMVAQYVLSNALTGRDQALARLQQEIAGLANLLSLERKTNAELRVDIEQLSDELQSSLSEKADLEQQIAALIQSRDDIAEQLRSSEAQSAEVRKELEEAYKVIDADKEKVEAQLAQLAILQQLRDDLRQQLEAAELKSRQVSAELEDAYKVIEADKEKIQAQLSDLAILQSLHDEMIAKLNAAELAQAEREEALSEQSQLTEEANARVLLLNRQVAALREQLARLQGILDAAEAENKEQEVQIADLGRRLNIALASKVQELARYRSEFFGRLREVLGNREDVRIVGDRFVFQSEVLFPSGSAQLEEGGKQQLARLAGTLADIARKIPDDLPWILQVEGHTDRAPISTAEFPSNWELSTQRAISVLKFLIDQGIPAEHLSAAGFGEFQPLDDGNSLEAFRRNRRIELKLTQR